MAYYPPIMKEDDLRAQIVNLARKYSRPPVRYVEPTPECCWNIREDEPCALDCSSLVTRLSYVVLGSYFSTLGDPSARTWETKLVVIDKPRPADLVFYKRPGDPNDPADCGRDVLYHVAVSDGAGNVIAACDVCDYVAEHPEQCPHGRWTLLDRPYRQFPFPPDLIDSLAEPRNRDSCATYIGET